MRVPGVGLAVVAGVEQANPGGQLGRHVDNMFAIFEQSLRQRPPRTVAASTAHTRSGHPATYLRIAA
ncbi:hypothetical protein GCM10009845_39080 [Pedococcus bigeumensis]